MKKQERDIGARNSMRKQKAVVRSIRNAVAAVAIQLNLEVKNVNPTQNFYAPKNM